jgi:putative PD-(D/E)XK family protein DUF4420
MSNILNKIKELLENQQLETYSRYDGEHPLDIFLGIDSAGRKSLVLTLQADKVRVISSKTITVTFFNRDDGRTSLRFSLEDDDLKDLFYKFCEDIIESTRSSKQVDGFSSVIERWNTWINFFSKTSLPLSESEVLGLIGEICFLQKVMVEKYGLDDALESYIGTDKAHKDFEIHDTWHEVKSIHYGVRSIKINSIEQLDSKYPGKLEIITFDQGTSNSEGNITLNGLVSDFKHSLDHKWQLLFDEKMRKANYIKDERYDDYNYIFVGIDEYNVTDRFPKISKDILPNGITKASYEIDISAIQQYKA